MEEKPSTEEVLLAVECLYSNPNQTEKENASLWLEQLQLSKYAWTIADELVHLNRDLISCYFGAHTMRKKIQSHFHELPIEVHASLRDSLIDHVSQINEGTNTAIVTQLCLALAGLILNMTSWEEPVLELISRFSQNQTWVLLEIITVLPEELYSSSNKLGTNRRSKLKGLFKICSPTVKNFVTFCSNNVSEMNDQANVKIIKCFTSWTSISEVFSNDIISNEIMFKVFRYLNEGSSTLSVALHDTCTDFVCELADCLTTANDNHDAILEGFLLNNVSLLQDAFIRSTTEMDQKKTSNYCRIFVEIAIALIGQMIKKDNNLEYHYGSLLNLLIISANHPDYRLAELTFRFWDALGTEVVMVCSVTLCDALIPYVDRLCIALLQHCQMAAEHEGLLEENDDRNQFRKSASELLSELNFIVPNDEWVRRLSKNLQLPEITWNAIEASLFIMAKLVKGLDHSNDEIIFPVVRAILNLPEDAHVAIRNSSILLLGQLHNWIKRHEEFLDPILNFLVSCLHTSELVDGAVIALKNIFNLFKSHMTRHIPALLELAQNVDTFSMDNRAISDLLGSIAGIIGCLPGRDIGRDLHKICALQIDPFGQLMSGGFAFVKNSKTDPAFWMKRLKYVFKGMVLKLTEECGTSRGVVVGDVWPTLVCAMMKYQHDFLLMDHCCMCMTAVLDSVKSQLTELVPPLVTLLMSLYGTHRHTCFLYLGGVLIEYYGAKANCADELTKMFAYFVNVTLGTFDTLNQCRLYSDTLKEFYRLCCRMLERCPLNVLKCTEFLPIFQRAMFICSLDYQASNLFAIKFFSNLFLSTLGREYLEKEKLMTLVSNVFRNYGQELTTILIRGCAFRFPSDIMEDVADVILEMLTFNQKASEDYIRCALESLLYKSEDGMVKMTPKQLKSIYVAIISADSELVEKNLMKLKKLHR